MYSARRKGKAYMTFEEAPILSVLFFKLSNRNPNTTHVELKVSDTEIAGSPSIPLRKRKWPWKANKLVAIIDFLTPEQRESVTVQESDAPRPVLRRLLKHTSPMMRGTDVTAVQQALNDNGAKLDPALFGTFGPKTKAAVKKIPEGQQTGGGRNRGETYIHGTGI